MIDNDKIEQLCDMGYEESTIFENPEYNDAIIGVDYDGRVVYDYTIMVDILVQRECMSEEEAVDFLDYNTLRSLPYAPDPKPIVMFRLLSAK